jgi:hypothetical protein
VIQNEALMMAVGDSVVNMLVWLVLGLAVFSVAALTITRRKRPNSVVVVGSTVLVIGGIVFFCLYPQAGTPWTVRFLFGVVPLVIGCIGLSTLFPLRRD